MNPTLTAMNATAPAGQQYVSSPTGYVLAPISGATSTTQPPASPVAVVSGSTATDHVNNTIVPTMQSAQQALTSGQQAKAANAGKPGYDSQGNFLTTLTAPPPAPPPQQTPKTPEEKIMSQPEAGNKFIYDLQGNQHEIGINDTIPTGYSATNPTIAPTTAINDRTTDPVGNQYIQYADGTYGKFDATGKYIGGTTQQEFQMNKTGQDTFDKLNQAINGNFPLTPDQQSQIDSVKAQFQQLIEQQKITNANFTGGTTVAQNLYGMGNSLIGLGAIKGSVDSGLAKIADLNTKMTSAVSQMTEAFKKDDLELLRTSYELYTSTVKDRQTELDKLNAIAVAAVKDTRDYNYRAAQDTITNILNSTKVSDQEKQDQLLNVLEQGKFEEEKRKNLMDEYYKGQDLKLREQAQNQNNPFGTGGPTIPPATMNGDNTVNKASQTTFLGGLPGGATGGVATLIKGLADYSINPNAIPTKLYKGTSGLNQGEMLALAKQYDPTFDEKQYSTRQALQKNFAQGDYSKNINALNTATGHITDITGNFSQLGNVGFTPYNAAKNTINSLFGSGASTKANLNIAAATSELATTFKGAGATDAEIKALGSIDANSGPDQVKQYTEAASQLLASRLNALENTYTSGMGKAPDKGFLSSDSANALLKLQQQGYDIKVPELAKMPVIQIQTFHDSSPQNAKIIDTIRQAAPNASPEDILSILENKGYLQ